ncbi:hypothetical protein [Pseudomonas sp. EA_35y_Pfl2_R111]|uniref:hypothetical protein n=1 Tax=Pseudomonas sp. EA_35y_Pfl2_R111 TaxID=3088689 RepID=UPI0030D8D902
MQQEVPEGFEGRHCLALMEGKINPDTGEELTNVSINHRISDADFEKYQFCFRDIRFYSECVNLYYSVQLNMEDLLRSILGIGKNYLDSGSINSHDARMIPLSISRLTLNLTSMFRSFLDHGDAALTRRYGPNSDELKSWKAKQSEVYDASRAYRFMSNLRNYCQHVGMPPLHYSIGSESGVDGVQIVLKYKSVELLDSYGRWQSLVKNDLTTGPEELHLFPYLQDWSVCFHRLTAWLLDFRRSAVLDSAALIIDMRSKYGIGDLGVIAIVDEPQAGDVLSLKMQHIPEAIAQEVIGRVPIIDLSESLELDEDSFHRSPSC